MKKQIKLGYEIKSGKQIDIDPDHLVVTGLTQQAGKTTCLESLIKRSERKAVVFKTKIGEKSFLQGTIIPPFFNDRSDWQFVQGLVEATIKEKLNSFDRARIINICEETGGHSLTEFKKKVDQKRLEAKPGGIEHSMLTNLQAYLNIVLPKLNSIKLSNTLELINGLNIIDLERFSRDAEVQSLIIASVVEEVLHKFKDVIIVIPESWKFIPQDRGNPCKLVIEEFIRQGAASGNYIWIDSQDMATVDKRYLKSISTWILGYQSEINEVKHTLQQIPLAANSKPKAEDIMTLSTGEFYLATRDRVIKVYVQPFWLDSDATAKKIAMGKMKVEEIDRPVLSIAQHSIKINKPSESGIPDKPFDEKELLKLKQAFAKELSELRTDFFNKIEDVMGLVNESNIQIHELSIKQIPVQEINIDEIVGKVKQKLSITSVTNSVPFDEETLIQKIIKRVPASSGAVTYEVAPLEMIKRKFLEEAKEKILNEISKLSDKAKKILKYLEARGTTLSTSEIATKSLFLSNGAGGNSTTTLSFLKELIAIEVAIKNANGTHSGKLRNRIEFYLNSYDAKPEEIDNLYNHIIVELLK